VTKINLDTKFIPMDCILIYDPLLKLKNINLMNLVEL
jgi:hypothetical protein